MLYDSNVFLCCSQLSEYTKQHFYPIPLPHDYLALEPADYGLEPLKP